MQTNVYEMRTYISSKGFGAVYVSVVPAFCLKWSIRLNIVDANGMAGRGASSALGGILLP